MVRRCNVFSQIVKCLRDVQIQKMAHSFQKLFQIRRLSHNFNIGSEISR